MISFYDSILHVIYFTEAMLSTLLLWLNKFLHCETNYWSVESTFDKNEIFE